MDNSQRIRQIIERIRTDITHIGFCDMSELSHFIQCRSLSLLPQRGSAIVMLLPYYTAVPNTNISLYAVPDDYHAIAKSILGEIIAELQEHYPENLFLPFVDSSPLPEVELAWRAGLGFIGKNGQLITEEYGSMVFVCEIVTDLPLSAQSAEMQNSCGNCNKCIDTCPSGALGDSSFLLDKCLSHITQKKGELTQSECEQIAQGGLAWGCDKCTLACPYNASLKTTPIAEFMQGVTPIITMDNYKELLPRKSFGWRGEKVIRRNLNLLSKQ